MPCFLLSLSLSSHLEQTMTSSSAYSRKIASNRLQKELVEWQVNPPAGFKHKVTSWELDELIDMINYYLKLLHLILCYGDAMVNYREWWVWCYWPKEQSDRLAISWPEELKSEWPQLSMLIPMTTSWFSSSSSSPVHEKLALLSLRLSREFDHIHMGLGASGSFNEPSSQKQTNWIPISWGTSMGGSIRRGLEQQH